MAHKFHLWTAKFLSSPGYNDIPDIVTIEDGPGVWSVLGVHKLTGDENRGNHHVYFDVIDGGNNRQNRVPVDWGWVGMRPDEEPGPVFADKPLNELPNIQIDRGQIIWMQIGNGDKVDGFRFDFPGNESGNSWGHHSYYVVFKKNVSDPDPDPPEAKGTMTLIIDKDFFNSLPVNEQGKVRYIVPVYKR